jgi:hypothetical protein
VLDSKDKNAKLSQQVKHIQELIEKIEPEDGRNVFVYENIKVARVFGTDRLTDKVRE